MDTSKFLVVKSKVTGIKYYVIQRVRDHILVSTESWHYQFWFHYLEVDEVTSLKGVTMRKSYSRPPFICDFCNTKIVDEFVDGATKLGFWSIMCPICFMSHGVGIGIGRGQRYHLDHSDGKFYNVSDARLSPGGSKLGEHSPIEKTSAKGEPAPNTSALKRT